eukprot:3689800-Rhodomonas_salina.3
MGAHMKTKFRGSPPTMATRLHPPTVLTRVSLTKWRPMEQLIQRMQCRQLPGSKHPPFTPQAVVLTQVLRLSGLTDSPPDYL